MDARIDMMHKQRIAPPVSRRITGGTANTRMMFAMHDALRRAPAGRTHRRRTGAIKPGPAAAATRTGLGGSSSKFLSSNHNVRGRHRCGRALKQESMAGKRTGVALPEEIWRPSNRSHRNPC